MRILCLTLLLILLEFRVFRLGSSEEGIECLSGGYLLALFPNLQLHAGRETRKPEITYSLQTC